jgi:hypothetical protein
MAPDPKTILRKGFEKALMMQQPLAVKNVERLRRVHPDETPAQLIKRLKREYLTTVTATGTAAGGAAMMPGVGIPAGLAAGTADMLAFTEASILYVLCLAEVHGLHPEDLERRRLLVWTVMLGDSAVATLDPLVTKTGGYWAKRIVQSIPMSAINKANKVLGPRFITKYGTKQGALVLGKQIPFGIGAVIGGGGNHVFGRLTIASAHKIFGAEPDAWPPATDPSPRLVPDSGTPNGRELPDPPVASA